jgi:hypothetical protein
MIKSIALTFALAMAFPGAALVQYCGYGPPGSPGAANKSMRMAHRQRRWRRRGLARYRPRTRTFRRFPATRRIAARPCARA